MTRWLRLYDDTINDPKILKLPEAMRWHWIAMLCVASKNEGVLPTLDDIAIQLRVTAAKATEIISTLVKAQLLDKIETGFAPHNWSGRQYKSDDPKPAKGKDSYVYIIGHVWGSEALKIGFSKNPWARITELQTAHHEKLSVLAVFKCRSHSEVDLHDILRPYRKTGEWFALPTKIYVAISNAADRSVNYDELVVELRDLLRSTTTEADADTKQRQTGSEARASDEASPVDHRKRLFDEGLPKIAKMTGRGPDACRSFVGKCLKAASDDAVTVLGLIDEAERNQVVDPCAWIAARLKTTENFNGKAKPGIIQAADDLRRKVASFDGPPDQGDDLRDGTRTPVARLLSHG